MNKILGLDLGTNSIGWAIREPNLKVNQIIDQGVVIFKKGVGEEKGVEFPLAAERTNKRGIRRNYQVKKYQKWQLIKTLIQAETSFCPLSKEDFNLWYHYDKSTKARVYPRDAKFLNWLKLDFDNDGVSEFTNPYDLRAKAIKEKLSNHEVGRAFYHLVQRRGFLSNRKVQGEENETINLGSKDGSRPGASAIASVIEKEGSLGAALATLDTRFDRIRNRYLLRAQVEEELNLICKVQGISLDSDFYKGIHKAIIWQRPLRSQKGLVGKCTLEKNKTRCPINRPEFEIFRAWSVINNIKYKLKSENYNDFRSISDEWKEKIWNDKFLKKKDSSFDFEDIIKLLDPGKVKQYDFNYKSYQSIAASPVCAGLFDIFGEGWETIKVDKYTLEDIWHVLFNFEDEFRVLLFASDKLKLDAEQAKKFVILWKKMPEGYGQLSLNAIAKINKFLRQGFIYSEAVFYSNMPKVLGTDFYSKHERTIQEGIKYIFNNQNNLNDTIKIANNLIGNYLSWNEDKRFGFNSAYTLDDNDKSDIEKAINDFYGSKTWNEFDEKVKSKILGKVSDLYLAYLKLPINGKGSHYYKIPRLDEAVISFLKDNFDHITDKNLEHLYHPSDNDIYTPAPIDKTDYKKYLQSPKTGSFKNPMAMRTMYELRKLVNYLIETNKIDDEDRIVIEIARELNDSNMRRAIEVWQNINAKKNEEYKKEIERNGFDRNSNDLLLRIRLWNEQGKQSIYTGEMITIADVFDGSKFQIEHTIPRSLSFDDSFENKTLCETAFNAKKGKRIPRELDNYSDIEPRLKPWIEKVEHYKHLVEINRKRSKSATTKEAKDKAIQDRHINKFELDYWRNKLHRFTMSEVKNGFRNANLVDTQIITKYAFHYLKSVFKRVDVQKGQVTSIFRKIYKINEDKDRSQHTHHTIDAAILTLIPKPKEREVILKKYFEAQESKLPFHQLPWQDFHQNQLMNLRGTTLVNNSTRDKSLLQTAKYVRKRGKIVYLTNSEGEFVLNDQGKKIPKVAKGDTIRGQLHNESMLGAIRLPKVDSNDQPLRDQSGDFEYDEKQKITYVIRKQLVFGDLGFTKREQLLNIIDPVVRGKVLAHIDKYGLNKETFKNPVWMNEEKRIRINKVRVNTGVSEPLTIRKHVFGSDKEYKKYYYAETAKGANIICVLYLIEGKALFDKIEIINLMDAAGFVSKELLSEDGEVSVSRTGKNGIKQMPYAILKQGTKVIFFKNDLSELVDLDKTVLSERLYRVLKFTGERITFEHHLEARSAGQISEMSTLLNDKNYFNGYSEFNFDKPMPRLRLTRGNFNFAIEGKHFDVKPDGEIIWISNT